MVSKIAIAAIMDYKELIRKTLGHKVKRIWLTPKSWHRCEVCKKMLFIKMTDNYMFVEDKHNVVGFNLGKNGNNLGIIFNNTPEMHCEKLKTLL